MGAYLDREDRFNGYKTRRRRQDLRVTHLKKNVAGTGRNTVFETLANMPFTDGNDVQLCIDGEATFKAIFAGIAAATSYLLVQFFIVRDDEIGRAFKARLLDAAARGVRIYFLFDEMGSHELPGRYIAELRRAGIDIRPFKTTKGAKNRFQLNFRNHRKIVVVDGRIAFVGGHNVGDDYLGKSRKFGHWRDTHVRVEGPVAAEVQVAFLEDWHWSSGALPEVDWQAAAGAARTTGIAALALPTGPADGLDTCCLLFLAAIQAAKHRVWITSPYFVPDAQIVSALQLAAMKGVDVRIILPAVADHVLVWLASFAYLKDAIPHGIKLYRYQAGFIHEKVLLIDDALSAVGTANFDNRSFRLNFGITMLFADVGFAKQVETMLLRDLEGAKPVTLAEIDGRGFPFRLAVRVARLLAPVL